MARKRCFYPPPEKPAARKCKACGDIYRPVLKRDNTLTDEEQASLDKARQEYCMACAKELVLGVIPAASSLMHGTGGGYRIIRDTRGLGG